MIDPADGGADSRKYKAFYKTIIVLGMGGAIALMWPTAKDLYSTFATAVVSCFGLYCGGNVANKLVAGTVNGKYFPEATVEAAKKASEKPVDG